ncbi:MAG: PqqD family peptide modification chaperone [Candidatus Daviesbacteria bacterium]|nr:PqqD family peptide modification chaperone [Candidatus Daviesbacteria bacterium]
MPVVINYRTGNIIDLNETGLFIWELLPNKVSTILDILASTYGRSNKTIKTDILNFLNELVDEHFILKNDAYVENSTARKAFITDLEVREKIKDLGMQKHIPITAEIELTNQCNLNCIHCFNMTDRRKKSLETAEMKHIIDELFSIGTILLIFTGGEVFSRKDIGELIEYADKKDFLIRILTNATLIGDNEIKMLKKFRVISVQVSIYSHIPEIHDSITKKQGSFFKSIKAIKKMISNNIHVEIATPLMKVNFSEREGIKKLAETLGIRHRYSYPIFERNDGSKDVYALRPSKKEIFQFFSEDLNQIIYLPRTEDEPICGVGVNTCMINPQGDLFPCTLLNIKIGNLLKQKLKVLWNSSEILKKLRKLRIKNLETCVKCPSTAYCNLCLGHNWKETKNILQPAKICCDYALNSMQVMRINKSRNVQTRLTNKKLKGGECNEKISKAKSNKSKN